MSSPLAVEATIQSSYAGAGLRTTEKGGSNEEEICCALPSVPQRRRDAFMAVTMIMAVEGHSGSLHHSSNTSGLQNADSHNTRGEAK